jgi:general secretion pathway protein L
MIRDFLSWWHQQLFSLLPERFAGKTESRSKAVMMTPLGAVASLPSVIEAAFPQNGKPARCERFAFDGDGLARLARQLATAGQGHPVWLALAPGAVLQKQLTFPAAVERDLDQVLRFEMDEETPFSADEVYWDWSVSGRDRAARTVTVSLCLVPRAVVAELLGRLRDQGILPQGLFVAGAGSQPVVLPLLHGGKKVAARWIDRPSLAWGVVAALAVILVVLPFLWQSVRFAQVDARIEASRPAAAEAQGLQARLDGTADGGDVIMAERHRFAEPLAVLADLTDVLPDDTFLSDLALKGHKLSLAGQSASATRLIGLLSGKGLVADPSFAAPVTRLGTDAAALEVFSISADVRDRP